MSTPITEHVNIFKSFSTWFLKYQEKNQVKVILMGIIVILVANVFWTAHYYDKKIAILEVKLDKLEIRNIELEKQVNQSNSEIIIFKAAQDFFPFSYWIKDLNGKMLYVNKSFEKRYITSCKKKLADFIGHYDFENFSLKQATQFAKADSLVIADDRPYSFYKEEKIRIYTVTKFPYKLNGQTIGVAGVEYELFK